MVTEEFNEKYKDYIVEGFTGLQLHYPKAIDYLDKEFQKLIHLPGFKFYQIKSKFKFFRFYCDGVSQEKIREIEDKLMDIYDEGNI